MKIKKTIALIIALLTFALFASCGRGGVLPASPLPQGADNAASRETAALFTPVQETIELVFTERPTAEPTPDKTPPPEPTAPPVDKDGEYWTRDEVALYILLYGGLPSNYITKREAQQLGWTGGSLEPYAPGKSIGGDRFGNYEGLLPKKSGRYYTECDIDTRGKASRGAKRIVFSNDGLIYYTDDHYSSFILLYGGDKT